MSLSELESAGKTRPLCWGHRSTAQWRSANTDPGTPAKSLPVFFASLIFIVEYGHQPKTKNTFLLLLILTWGKTVCWFSEREEGVKGGGERSICFTMMLRGFHGIFFKASSTCQDIICAQEKLVGSWSECGSGRNKLWNGSMSGPAISSYVALTSYSNSVAVSFPI